MKLKVITPFSRTVANINAIYESLQCVAENTETEWIIVYEHAVATELMEWHRRVESQQNLAVKILRGNTATSYYGNSYRNQAVGQLSVERDAWVYFLDDDTIMHPQFPQLLRSLCPDDEVVFFSQAWNSLELRLEPYHICVGGVDTAMFLVRGGIIKKYKWKENEYTADGLIAEELVANHRSRAIFTPYCFYNYLR